jgi:hypothetical protein
MNEFGPSKEYSVTRRQQEQKKKVQNLKELNAFFKSLNQSSPDV